MCERAADLRSFTLVFISFFVGVKRSCSEAITELWMKRVTTLDSYSTRKRHRFS